MANLFQLPVVLATDPINGVPLSGGKLFFYKNNTSTKKDTYTTSAKTTPHSNPVVADSGGYFPEIWLDGVYSWKLTDADDVLIDEGDDLSGMVNVLISNVFHKVNTFDGGIIVDPEHATDRGTDAFVSATNTTPPEDGRKIVRDFQSANETTTPELDGITITTKDGSPVWPGALSGVHELQLASGGGSWLVLDPNPSSQVDPIAYADTKLAAPTGSTDPGLAFDTWRTPDADRMTYIVARVAVSTDGSSSGFVDVEVDESGGTTPDYAIRVNASSSLPSSTFILNAPATYIPAGGSYRVANTQDPNDNNELSFVREFPL